MATAIDFKALMAEERRRARNKAAAPATAPAAAPAAAPSIAASSQQRYRLPASDARPALEQVACGIETVQHVADWITPAEETALIRCIDEAPQVLWTTLRGRRLQSLGGQPCAPPQCMTHEPLPPWVESVCNQLVRCGIFPADAPPNHVLLNEYQPGQGIDAHKDGPLYAPHVAILSLGSHATFEFLEDSAARPALVSLLLPSRGLLLFTHDAYESHLHTVPPVVEDDLSRPELVRLDCPAGGATVAVAGRVAPRSRRLSLTVRRVLHTPARSPTQGGEAEGEGEWGRGGANPAPAVDVA